MNDWDAIPLSRLSHAGYCLRRAALLTNEQLWKENADTAKGREAHKRVHTSRIERRGDHLQLFEYDVFSKELNIVGKCDCIEATRDETGCIIPYSHMTAFLRWKLSDWILRQDIYIHSAQAVLPLRWI